MVPIDRDHVHLSHARLVHTIERLRDDQARRPSRLPGWTVGHVLTHLARNADSHVRLLEAAGRGEVGDQYPGGVEQRDGDIEAGSGRPAAELVDDVVTASARLEAAWDATTDEVWRTGQGRVSGGTWPVAELPFRRWREVEMHHVDLGLGYEPRSWPDAYVDVELGQAVAGLRSRLPDGVAVSLEATDAGHRWVVPEAAPDAVAVRAERRVLLAWLVGRAAGDPFPLLGPWNP